MTKQSFQPAELAIRLRRAAFNAALAAAQVEPIGPILAKDVLLVTGTDSGIIAGRNAQLKAWKQEFAAANRTLYTRTPASIIVSAVEPIALEHGHWRGVRASDGAAIASGDYSAKWRHVAGEWVVEAEIYVTLT